MSHGPVGRKPVRLVGHHVSPIGRSSPTRVMLCEGSFLPMPQRTYALHEHRINGSSMELQREYAHRLPDPRSCLRTHLLLVCLVIGAVAQLSGQDATRPAPGGDSQGLLSRGDTVTQTITAGTTHEWRVPAAGEQYVVVEVTQLGIDMMVYVVDPQGAARAPIDWTEVPEPEVASWITDSAGTWTVKVTPFAEVADSGSYAIVLVVSRNATERDRWLVEADDLTNRAWLLEDEGMAAEAEGLHRQALALYQSVYGPDATELLASLADLGRVIEQQGRFADAEPVYRQALDITIQASGPTHPDVGAATMELARLFIDAARYPEAQAEIEQALRIFTAVYGSQHVTVAGVLSDLGRVHWRQANYESAESYYHQAITMLEAVLAAGDPQLAITLNNLAVLYVAQARYQEARELYRRMIDLNTVAYGPDDRQVAIGQYNLAQLLKRSARLDEAEPLYRRSLATHMAMYGPNHRAVGYLLLGLAGLLEVQGSYAEAEQLYRRTLVVFESVLPPGHPDIAGPLVGMAHVYQHQGRSTLAVDGFRQALETYETSLGPEHRLVASTLSDLAALHIARGDYEAADSLTARALVIEEALFGPDHPDVARTLRAQAMSYDGQGSYADAVPLWNRSLEIFEAELGPGHPETAHSLIGTARAEFRAGIITSDSALTLIDRAIGIYDDTPGYSASRVGAYVSRATMRRLQGDHEGAIEDLDEALLSVDEQRAQVGGDEETRARFFESYAYLFAQMAWWQLEAGDTASAFTYAERGRARVLLDQLAAGKIDIRSSIPADIRGELERREADAQARLAEFQQRITLLRSRADLSDEERHGRIDALEDSLRLADAEYRRVYADIKNASPLWRDEITSGGRPSSLRDIQRTVVPRDGLMLSYQIGTEQSVVFVIPPRGRRLQAVSLEITDSIAAALGGGVEPGPLTTQVLRTILAGDSTEAGPERGGVFHDLSAPARGTKVAGRVQVIDPETLLHALWQVLLPEAAWLEVLSATEVVIIPDGPLHYLPFEALVVDTVPRPHGITYWLDEGPPVRYAASATTLANITRRPSARVVDAAGPMMLSVSDPIFDPAEVASMLQSAADSTTGEPRDTTAGGAPPARASYQRGGGSLARLPGTAHETDIVRNAFGASAARDLEVLSGLEANESNLRTSIEGKRFLHLATHGLVDQRRGTLFASLALTPPSGETTDHENDGFWQLHEIYELRLPGLELAVLSACESNVGRNMEGEGVFALSRGFTAAGAQRVVASQWSVDDASTAQLIGEFFRLVLTEEIAGRQVDYAVALRDAKRAVRMQEQWRDPYFWAPFVLTGKR